MGNQTHGLPYTSRAHALTTEPLGDWWLVRPFTTNGVKAPWDNLLILGFTLHVQSVEVGLTPFVLL